MMGGQWQLAVVIAAVCVAAALLARRAWRAARGQGEGCGGCSKCDSPTETQEPLVELGDHISSDSR